MSRLACPAREGTKRRRAATGGGSHRESADVTARLAVVASASAAPAFADAPPFHVCAPSNQRQPQGDKIKTGTRRRLRRVPATSLFSYTAALTSVSLSILCSTPCCFGLPAGPASPGDGSSGSGRLPFGSGPVGPERNSYRGGSPGDHSGLLLGECAVGTGDARDAHPQHQKYGEDQARQQDKEQQRLLKQRHGLVGGREGVGAAARRTVGGVTAAGALGVRGGVKRPWFTGFEDTTQEESSSEESESTEYGGGSYDGDFTTDNDDDDKVGGNDAANTAKAEEPGKRYAKEQVEARENKEDDKQGGEAKATKEDTGGAKKDEGDGDTATPEARRQAVEDIYARTIARRKAMALAFRILQRTLGKAAFLLVAFQIFPWLRNNFLVQCLLVGSLLLQTVTELVGIARAADAAGKPGKGRGQGRPGDDPVKGSGADTPPSSSSSAGVIGGLMKVFSPEDEQRQHLDFQRLNEMFDKDVEALAAASQPKTDLPSMLLPTGPMGGSALPVAGMMMKAFKGLAGKHEDKNNNDKVGDSDNAGGRSSAPPGRSPTGDKSGMGGREKSKKHRRFHRKKAEVQPPQEEKVPPQEGQAKRSAASEETEGTQKGEKNPVEERSQTERFAVENVRTFDADGRGTPAEPKEIAGVSGGGRVDEGCPVEGREVRGQVANVGKSGGGHGGAKNGTVVASSKLEKRVFVVKFRPGHGPEEGQEQQMELLSATVSFLAANGNNATDEVVLLLESGGGEVSTFGLAAAKLARLKDSGFKLTVCVDKIAASGGYMMACIADKLMVAPFAMLGSIGVVGGMPNFNKALKKFGVDYFHFTAGQQKSLVGPFQEVTKANQAMQQRQMDTIHTAFKEHVQRYRPTVDVEAVGTGEVWLGQQAVELRLADEVGTAMEYLQGRMSDSQVFLVKQHKKKISGGTGLLRALLLGPLARAGSSGFSGRRGKNGSGMSRSSSRTSSTTIG